METFFQSITKEMLSFIQNSPSVYHVADNILQTCVQQGFVPLKEQEEWKLQPGGKYIVLRNDSAILAFVLPDKRADEIKGFHITASHGDSPGFKVKENPEIHVEEHYTKWSTEGYGGMLISTWFDRPLSAAGRVFYSENGKICSKLVDLQESIGVIPSLAIHMNRNANKGVEYHLQKDTLPLICSFEKSDEQCYEKTTGQSKGAFTKVLAEKAGLSQDDILDYDLFLYVKQEGQYVGLNQEWVLSPKLDDLLCVYASMRAFLSVSPVEYINMLAVFDNEEVGSGSGQGADSDFLENTCRRIAQSLDGTNSIYERWLADSFLLSCDNAHGVHPNFPEMSDATNRPYLNGGLVLKYQGSLKYTTDGYSGAKVKQWCRQAEVPCQTYANRSDLPGGSTLGHIALSHTSIKAADIGIAQLGMHSAVEMAGVKDTGYMMKALQEFYKE